MNVACRHPVDRSTEMTKGQIGTSIGASTETGRLTTAPSRTRRSAGGVSTRARRIAAIPEPPNAASPSASAETHGGGAPVDGSGDSLSTAFLPWEPSGRESKRACGGTGKEICDRAAARAGTAAAGASSVEIEASETGARPQRRSADPLVRSRPVTGRDVVLDRDSRAGERDVRRRRHRGYRRRASRRRRTPA